MWLFILEAGSAMFLLVFIVWWTMFSGQKPTPPASATPKKTASEHDALRAPANASDNKTDEIK